jgi:hypothetical protein
MPVRPLCPEVKTRGNKLKPARPFPPEMLKTLFGAWVLLDYRRPKVPQCQLIPTARALLHVTLADLLSFVARSLSEEFRNFVGGTLNRSTVFVNTEVKSRNLHPEAHLSFLIAALLLRYPPVLRSGIGERIYA